MGKKKKDQLANELFDSLLDEESAISDFSVDDAESDYMSNTARALWSDISSDGSDSPSDSALSTEEEDPLVGLDPEPVTAPAEESPKVTFQSIGEEEATLAINVESVPVFSEPKAGRTDDENTLPINLENSQTLKVGGSLSQDTLSLSDENTVAVSNAPRHDRNDEEQKEKVSFGFNPGGGLGATPLMGTQEAALVQAENLRIAQQRILDLEKEVENLRRENEQLSAAGESLKRRTDELTSKNDKLETQMEDQKESYEGEISILRESVSHKEKQNAEIRQKVEELEYRINNDLKKIRIRERELEHRLELVKMENEALARNKDETILGLKRQQDQLNHETEGYRSKMQDLYRQLGDNQDRFRRTVRALRLALSNLELSDDGVALKKAE